MQVENFYSPRLYGPWELSDTSNDNIEAEN